MPKTKIVVPILLSVLLLSGALVSAFLLKQSKTDEFSQLPIAQDQQHQEQTNQQILDNNPLESAAATADSTQVSPQTDPATQPPQQTQTPSNTNNFGPKELVVTVANANISSMNRWHPPGAHDGLNVHEHGDAPPAWADKFSTDNFGHPVIWGGDESTPSENNYKHQAYKGIAMTASGVDLYIRHHSQSNPMGRMAPLHSYEVYGKDGSGNVSFWQGWMFFGYPEVRSQRMTRAGEFGGYDETYGITWPGRDQFIIASPDHDDWDNHLRCEQWYGTGDSILSWDFGITICGASTYYTLDEHLGDVADMSTWMTTGQVGDHRRIEVSHYGPENPNVNSNENPPTGEWFCIKKEPTQNRATGSIPKWDYTAGVAGPTACEDGWLPQYVADTFPKAGVYFQTGNTYEKAFPSTGVTLPN